MLRPKPEYAEALMLSWSHADLAAHCSLFGYLTLMPELTGWGRRNALRCTIGLLVFGALLEFGQSLTCGRTASLADAFANTAGVFLGCVIGHLLRRRKGADAI
jgi:VanZ family protein